MKFGIFLFDLTDDLKKTVLANRRCITSLAAMKRSTWRWAEARTTSPPSSTTVSGKPNISKMPQRSNMEYGVSVKILKVAQVTFFYIHKPSSVSRHCHETVQYGPIFQTLVFLFNVHMSRSTLPLCWTLWRGAVLQTSRQHRHKIFLLYWIHGAQTYTNPWRHLIFTVSEGPSREISTYVYPEKRVPTLPPSSKPATAARNHLNF